jgi:hypothetical protein
MDINLNEKQISKYTTLYKNKKIGAFKHSVYYEGIYRSDEKDPKTGIQKSYGVIIQEISKL